jgi:hypothetical protein
MEKQPAEDFLQKLTIQVDALATCLTGESEEDVELALEVIRRDVQRNFASAFGPQGAARLASAFTDAVERRSREIEHRGQSRRLN